MMELMIVQMVQMSQWTTKATGSLVMMEQIFQCSGLMTVR